MEDKRFCTNCGKELSVNVRFCPYCGEKAFEQENGEKEVLDNVKILEEETKEAKEKSLIDLLDKIPEKPTIRKRVMWGFLFVAIVFLLTGYFVTALFCAIAGILLHDRIYDKFKGVKKFFLLVGLILCFGVGVVSFELKEMENEHISVIQEGSFNAYPDREIGVAFERFFDNAKWVYFVSDDGQDIVEFTGRCKYDGVNVDVLMQFTIDDDGTFEITYLSYNEVSQNMIEIISLVEAVFSEYR